MFLPHVSMLLLWTLAVLTAADPVCDPETQYLRNGECCQMCKPGTSMLSMGACRDPVCKECDRDEYTDTYNTESMCQQQPYCDINSNFEWPKSTSKTVRHQCLCKDGFHCSSASCITCVPHTECEPGHGATIIGDHTRDTVCETCPDGTFSEEKSWNGTCNARQGLQRAHVGLIVALVLLALVIAGAGVLYRYKCKGKTGHEPLKILTGIQTDYNNHYQVTPEDEEKGTTIITTPTDDREREMLRSPSQETSHPSGPPVETDDVVLTANGDVLSQDGKDHVISQPETQAITI